MSESSDMLFVTMLGKADALGDLTTTNPRPLPAPESLQASRRLRLSLRGRPQQRHTGTRRPTGLRTADS